MTEREKLIELLKQDNCPSPMFCSDNCKYVNSSDCAAERCADHLLANGVTVLPCKAGDTVYQTDNAGNIYESKVTQVIYNTKGVAFDEMSIGKTIFLTLEEAEKAIAERCAE